MGVLPQLPIAVSPSKAIASWSMFNYFDLSPAKLSRQPVRSSRLSELYLVCPSFRCLIKPASLSVFEWWQNRARLIPNLSDISEPLISWQTVSNSTICKRVGSESAAKIFVRCSLFCLSPIPILYRAVSPSMIWLSVSSFAIGFTTIVAQLIIPFAAQIADKRSPRAVVGLAVCITLSNYRITA